MAIFEVDTDSDDTETFIRVNHPPTDAEF